MRPIPPNDLARAADLLRMSCDELADLLTGGSRLTSADLDRRDEMLRTAAARHFGGLASVSARADRLHEGLARYATSAWRQRDQWAGTNPHSPGSRSADFWEILRLSSHVASARTIRRVLVSTKSRRL